MEKKLAHSIPFYRGKCTNPHCGVPVDSTYCDYDIHSKMFICSVCEADHDPGKLYFLRLHHVNGRSVSRRKFVKSMTKLVDLLANHGWLITSSGELDLAVQSPMLHCQPGLKS